jgi:hypothetical protein
MATHKLPFADWNAACHVAFYRVTKTLLIHARIETNLWDYWSSGYEPETAARELAHEAGFDVESEDE